jgi:hypothetical protein
MREIVVFINCVVNITMKWQGGVVCLDSRHYITTPIYEQRLSQIILRLVNGFCNSRRHFSNVCIVTKE